jgi:hypothetical protein
VKLKVVHDLCGRESLVQQILESGGHCPWDGRPFSAEYTAVLAEALEAAESSGSTLENALEKMGGMNAALSIDPSTLIEPLREQLSVLNRRQAGKARR